MVFFQFAFLYESRDFQNKSLSVFASLENIIFPFLNTVSFWLPCENILWDSDQLSIKKIILHPCYSNLSDQIFLFCNEN